jgi:Bacteriocin-protection, YdeI or OmpD-Associated
MGRQPDQTPGRRSLCDQSYAAQADQQVVGHQSETLQRPQGGWPARSSRPRCGSDGQQLYPHPPIPELPVYVAKAFKTNLGAWQHFQALAPTYRRDFVVWIHTAKRPAMRERRIRESIELLADVKKLGFEVNDPFVRTQSAHAASLIPSTRLSHSRIWFQLGNVRLRFRASGLTRPMIGQTVPGDPSCNSLFLRCYPPGPFACKLRDLTSITRWSDAL